MLDQNNHNSWRNSPVLLRMVLLYHLVNRKYFNLEVVKVGLTHQFAVIPKESNENIIVSSMEYISMPDVIVLYISDSLNWINTTWNGIKIKNGISYYGFSFIEGDEIEKFSSIIIQWKLLFSLSTDEFYLRGEFMLDKNKYENNLIKRDEIIKNSDDCIDICKKAISKGDKILHNGI